MPSSQSAVTQARSSLQLLSLLIITNSLATLVAGAQNIDTQRPVLREVNGLANDSLFGYSLVLHQTVANPSNMAEAVGGARIVVSAPKGTAPGSSVPNTGLVYSCPVNPGLCSPLPGKLFDTTPNILGENKTGQFLGASMDSNGESFVVCAHRHVRITSPTRILLQGKCFITEDRSLTGSYREYQPCQLPRYNEYISTYGVCQAGTSSVIVTEDDSYTLGLGAPGINFWRGSVIRQSGDGITNFQGTGSNTGSSAYQGYAITAGRFMSSIRKDFAVSLPRRNMYFGTVNLVMNDNSLSVVSQPLNGMQMGEYFGFSLLAVDLNGDDYDELLVGAPLYRTSSTNPEIGRVFLYRNNRGNLELMRTIEGRTRFSRFGYAMANLGDINGDGWDDVAISAPFAETNSNNPGTVFIYHSAPNILLSNDPQQVISGTDLSLTTDLSGLRGFGTSLASGVDVDRNGYNDLLVGSFLSQQAFLLRTRPFAHTQILISANPLIVDVLDKTQPECEINSTQFACFNLTACVMFDGRGLPPDLNLTFTISGDVENVEHRIIFANSNATIVRRINARINTQSCITLMAYVQNSIQDIYNPFIMELSVATPPREIDPGNGNETLDDLSGFPVVVVTGTSQVQVETLKECGGGECIPDLRISVTGTQFNEYGSSTITAGLRSFVNIFLAIENAAEDAFQASLSFFLPTNLLELVNVFNQTRNGEVTLRCLSEPLVEEGQSMDLTHYSCSIGNPFQGPGSLQLRVQLLPSNDIIGNENDVIVNFTLGSVNPENASTIMDDSNFDSVQLMFEASANITIDDGVVTPERVSYSDNSAISKGDTPQNVSQLGPPVDVSFLIRNSGPSRIANIQLDISWPLNSSVIGENYYLYITSIQSSGSTAMTCSNEYINPLNLESDFIDQGDEEGGDPTASMGTGRRKKRSTVKRTLRNKRQETLTQTEQGLSENVTLSCISSESNIVINCVNIRCNILGLVGSSSVQVDVNSRLDERFFSTNNDHYIITPVASVSIVDGDFIQSNDDSSQRRADAQIFVIPAAPVVRVNPDHERSSSVAWWVIVVPILAAVIAVTVVGVLLQVFGFFRRQKHEEIKQKREEMQNLDEHGVTPMGAGVFDTGTSQNFDGKLDGTDL